MQQGRAPDTSQPRGKEVGEESESSISTSSSSAGIPLDSLGDEGHYRDDEPLTYETVEHFPGAIELDPRRGYVRHVGGTEAGSSSGTGLCWTRSKGKYSWSLWGLCWSTSAMYGQYKDYSYDPNWVPPSPTPILFIRTDIN
ncbi:hypothetical protein AAC387_Pa02g0717 [Persea americana]